MVDVVPVANEREHEPVELPEPLPQGEHVGESLAWVLPQCQPVDDRNRRLGSELDDDGMRSRPGHDRVDEPLEIAGNVTRALPGAHDDVLGQVDRMPAELVHPRFERDTGTQARPLEEHRERAPGERRFGVPARREELSLELCGTVEHPEDLVATEVGNRKKVATSQ